MENFNQKFKDKELQQLAWQLARTMQKSEFDAVSNELMDRNAMAMNWLLDVGKEKWALLYSAVPRFGTVTSNNVESVNSVLRHIRSLPILDCLMAIERYVGTKWFENCEKGSDWSLLTKTMNKRMESVVRSAHGAIVLANSPSSMVVRVSDGQRFSEFAVRISADSVSCSCGYSKDMLAPCEHAIVAMKKRNRMDWVGRLYHHTWTTTTFVCAHHDRRGDVQPFVTKDELLKLNHTAPQRQRKRGRPKKKPYESQKATKLLTQQRYIKCGKCGQVGHNKRTCHS